MLACVGCDPSSVRVTQPSRLCLLRLGILQEDTVNLDRVHAILTDPSQHPHDRDKAAIVADAFRGQATGSPLATGQWHQVQSIYTLPWLAAEITNLSFNHDIATVKDPLTNLLSKGLTSRCQTRLVGRVTEKYMYESPDDLAKYERVRAIPEKERRADDTSFLQRYRSMKPLRDTFKSIVLCSWLGNYPHVSGTRLSGKARALSYDLFGQSGEVSMEASDAWFQAILHQAPKLVVWCVREYLVHALLDQPGLLAAVGDFIQFDAFRRITGQAMDAVRTYIQQNLGHSWSSMGMHANWAAQTVVPPSLCRCSHKRKNQRKGEVRRARAVCIYEAGSEGTVATMTAASWLHDVTRLLQPYHDAMLVESYHKPDPGMVSFLMSRDVRMACPLLPRPVSEEEKAAKDTTEADFALAEQKEQEEDEMRAILNEQLGVYKDDRGSLMATARYKALVGDKNDARAKDDAKDKSDARAAAAVFDFLTPPQFQALSRLAESASELDQLVPLYDLLGVDDPRVIAFILVLLNHHRDGSVTGQERMRQVRLLHAREPHAYNLLQISAELLKRNSRKRAAVVGFLSAGTYEAQLDACRTKSLEILQADDELRVSGFDKCILKYEAKDRKNHEEWGLILDQLRDLRGLFQQRIARMAEVFTGSIEESSVCLYVCPVCNHVYSNVREAGVPKFYRWGLQKAGCDYTTGTLHCERGRVSDLGRCSTQPLQRVNLLGIRYGWDKKTFQLCVGCGDVFCPDPDACTDQSGRGMLCCACTRSHRRDLNTVHDAARSFVAGLDLRCAFCNEAKNTMDHTHLYPFDLVLCHKHHSKAVKWRVEQAVRGDTGWRDYGTVDTRENTRKFLINLIVSKKRDKQLKQQRRGVAAMKRGRQKNRQKKC